jgi:nucleoside-diphosphate-sugar epimerase
MGSEGSVLLLGGTGFVGAAVRLALGRVGHRFVTAARGDEAVLRRDLSAPGNAAALVRDLAPSMVVNCAGYGVSPDERDTALAWRINRDVPAEVADALATLPAAGVRPSPRLVHLGSAFEYGSVTGRVSEETPCRPQSLYAETKLAGTSAVQEVARATGLRATTLRIATVYGPRERAHRLLPSLLRLRQGGRLDLTEGGQERDFTFVEDVAEGIIRILRVADPPPPVLNLATGRSHTVRHFVEVALATLDIPLDRVRFGAVPYRPDEVWQGPIDVARLEAVLGWRPSTGLAKGIRRTAEWSDRHGQTSD